jgi:hypothetical protein
MIGEIFLQLFIGQSKPLETSTIVLVPKSTFWGSDFREFHNTLDVSHLTVIAQQAWNQGVDLYGYSNNRILAISEHTSKGNLKDTSTNNFYTVPYVPYVYGSNYQYTFSNGSQGANFAQKSNFCLKIKFLIKK